jgi:glucokinase
MIEKLNSQHPVLAIDIGGTKIAGGLVTPDGEVHHPDTVPTQAWGGGEAVMSQAIDLARQLLSVSQSEPALQPAAIGVSTGGLVVLATGAISFATSAIPGWGGMPVRDRMAKAVGLPVVVENDGNAMVLGEAIFGAGKGHPLVVGITVGTGIGGGIAMNGQLFHGAHGFSNNIGHTLYKINGRRCPCGRRGCLEAYASGPAISAEFKNRVGSSRLRAEFGLQPGRLGVKEISRLAAQGIPEAIAALRQGADILGAGIASLINLLDPDIVVVGGGAAQSGEIYFSRLREVAAARVLPGAVQAPIIPAALKTWANLVGAACLVWEKAY